MDIDQLPARTQVVLARAVQLEQESHRACPDARRAHADVDLFVEQDRNLVIDLGPRDVEFGTAVTGPAVVDACRAPIFGDPDVEIFEVTTVEHDALRVDLGVADALGNVEFEVAAGHEYPLDQKLFFVSRKDAKARRCRAGPRENPVAAGDIIMKALDRKSTRLNSRHKCAFRMPT